MRLTPDARVVQRAIRYLDQTQETIGGWTARWGVHYLYGTWCALAAYGALGYDVRNPRVGRAVAWLESVQRPDGGYGESSESYDRECFVPLSTSVPSQTAWALMGLTAAGAAPSKATQGAATYLLNQRNENGGWEERHFTGTGFPKHFYIRYHGYRHYFPLLALGRYLNTVDRGS
jgi:squalene-hopene/tetraprenyl-beta-curcumene cyclase